MDNINEYDFPLDDKTEEVPRKEYKPLPKEEEEFPDWALFDEDLFNIKIPA